MSNASSIQTITSKSPSEAIFSTELIDELMNTDSTIIKLDENLFVSQTLIMISSLSKSIGFFTDNTLRQQQHSNGEA